eukprot:8605517-Pyramimonas_sp.AAC.2
MVVPDHGSPLARVQGFPRQEIRPGRPVGRGHRAAGSRFESGRAPGRADRRRARRQRQSREKPNKIREGTARGPQKPHEGPQKAQMAQNTSHWCSLGVLLGPSLGLLGPGVFRAPPCGLLMARGPE